MIERLVRHWKMAMLSYKKWVAAVLRRRYYYLVWEQFARSLEKADHWIVAPVLLWLL